MNNEVGWWHLTVSPAELPRPLDMKGFEKLSLMEKQDKNTMHKEMIKK